MCKMQLNLAVVLFAVLACCTLTPAHAQKPADLSVAEWIQSLSVTVRAANSSGCGTVITRKIGGKNINFIQTCAHVVEDCRHVKEVIDSKGTTRHIVSYDDVEILKNVVRDGREVGRLVLDAKVFKCDRDEDIAVLRLIADDYIKGSIVFYKSDEAPKVGTTLYHCGSPGGHKYGAHSVTSGIIAQTGRVIDDQEYDQVTCACIGGSSGGAIINQETGEYLGTIVSGLVDSDSFNYMVPIRRIRAWAKQANVEWLYDESLPCPTEDELSKIPIEDDASALSDDNDDDSQPVSKPRLIDHLILQDDDEAAKLQPAPR